MSEITARNQARSPLLRLPAELRNRIYAYTMTMPESVWDQSDPNVYFSSRYNYYMKRPDDLAETKRDEQRDIQRKHLSIILACQQTYKECRLLPFTLHTIFFDSGSCMSLWIGKLHERQRHAIRSLHLEYTWTQKRGLRHGTVIPATQTWLRELNELRRVEVTVKIAFPMIRAEVGEEELKRQLDAVAGTFKKAMEEERPGLEYVVRALYVERGSS